MRNGTDRAIAAMLVENTGAGFMDSGGIYGRNHERNAGKTLADFRAEPVGTVEFEEYDGKPEATAHLSVFHFLSNTLKYDAKLTRTVKQLWKDGDGLSFLDDAAFLGCDDWQCVNTYNAEDLLTQVVQYWVPAREGFERDGKTPVVLQVHGGCDVRWGYTEPRVFWAWAEDSPSIYDNARGRLFCENGHAWDTDDAGAHFYPANDEPEADGIKVQDGKGLCPVCGAVLQFGF